MGELLMLVVHLKLFVIEETPEATVFTRRGPSMCVVHALILLTLAEGPPFVCSEPLFVACTISA